MIKDRADNFASAWYGTHNRRAGSGRSRSVCTTGTSKTSHENLPIAEVLRAVREVGAVPKQRSYWGEGGSVKGYGSTVAYIRRTWPLSQFVKFYTYNESNKLHDIVNYLTRKEFSTTEKRRAIK